MALSETCMNLAVKLAERALSAAPTARIEARIDAFRGAYAVIVEAADSVEHSSEWAEDTLKAAWDLAADAFPKGGSLTEVTDGFRAAHSAILETAEAPPRDPKQPSRPRRNG